MWNIVYVKICVSLLKLDSQALRKTKVPFFHAHLMADQIDL